MIPKEGEDFLRLTLKRKLIVWELGIDLMIFETNPELTSFIPNKTARNKEVRLNLKHFLNQTVQAPIS